MDDIPRKTTQDFQDESAKQYQEAEAERNKQEALPETEETEDESVSD